MATFVCAPAGGGCGVVWTDSHNVRPVRDLMLPWAWCPDCQRENQAVRDGFTDQRRERRRRRERNNHEGVSRRSHAGR